MNYPWINQHSKQFQSIMKYRKAYRKRAAKTNPSYSSIESSMDSCSTHSSYTRSTSSIASDKESKSYQRLKHGLKKSIPAAVLLWAFHKIPSKTGLTSRRISTFIKKHYRVTNNMGKNGKTIGSILRCAVDFGLLEKRGTRYFLAMKRKSHWVLCIKFFLLFRVDT